MKILKMILAIICYTFGYMYLTFCACSTLFLGLVNIAHVSSKLSLAITLSCIVVFAGFIKFNKKLEEYIN